MTATVLRAPAAHVVAGTIYVVAMVAVAAIAAWPVYGSVRFITLVVLAVIAAFSIAVAHRMLRLAWWVTGLVTLLAFLVLGVLLAVPARPLIEFPVTILDVLAGVVTGWKDLITVELPVGTYRNLLVPALAVFLGGALTAFLLSWRRTKGAAVAAVVCLAMALFGLAFGRPFASPSLEIGAFTIPAPRELLTGALALVFSIAWLSWLALDERRRALRRAADTSGVRVSRVRSASDGRRTMLAGAMVLVSVALAAAAAPAIAGDRSRDVLRTGIGPEVDVRTAITPLTSFRDGFDDARFDAVLFQVDGAALPDRVRLATLTSYDGVMYHALDPASSVADARFLRVPSGLDAGSGAPVDVEITIGDLDGIWLPTAGRLGRLTFDGDRSARLTDGFYYNASSSAAVDTVPGGLVPGDSYTFTGVEPRTPALASVDAPGQSAATVEAPPNLVEWVQLQDAGTGGAGLAALVDLLRERGYLSHGLQIDEDDPPAWVTALGDYTFQPSAAGHSLARVDALFRQLLDRQNEDADGTLVSAIGDQEQFAVAVALLAEYLGFPARVVVGAHLSDPGDGQRYCVEGACRAGDLTAWVEVQSSEGDWIPVDVAPQYEEPIDTDVRRERDPENVTEVRPETAQEVVPPDPTQQDSTTPDDTQDDAGWDLAALWAGLRVAGIVLLVLTLLLGPFLLVLAAKAVRRRGRRDQPDSTARVVGGWDELVDTAVDYGLPPPRAQTRTELALLYGGPPLSRLADTADRAVFSRTALTDAEAQEFWRIVDSERRGLAESRTLWQRVRAAVSLKSFTRSWTTRAGRSRSTQLRRTERRRRRGGGAQST